MEGHTRGNSGTQRVISYLRAIDRVTLFPGCAFAVNAKGFTEPKEPFLFYGHQAPVKCVVSVCSLGLSACLRGSHSCCFVFFLALPLAHRALLLRSCGRRYTLRVFRMAFLRLQRRGNLQRVTSCTAKVVAAKSALAAAPGAVAY